MDVNTSNIAIGVRVRRGRAWRPEKWRDDLDKRSTAVPKPRVAGTVVGFTNAAYRTKVYICIVAPLDPPFGNRREPHPPRLAIRH